MQMQNNQSCQKGHSILKESCPHCKALRKEWYKCLKNEGFEDLESEGGLIEEANLRRGRCSDFDTRDQFDNRFSYYQWARDRLDDGRFDSTKSQLIWEMHSEGMSRREIAPRVGYENSWISRKLRKIETYLKARSQGSGSSQLDLMFWAEPWHYVS